MKAQLNLIYRIQWVVSNVRSSLVLEIARLAHSWHWRHSVHSDHVWRLRNVALSHPTLSAQRLSSSSYSEGGNQMGFGFVQLESGVRDRAWRPSRYTPLEAPRYNT